MPEKPLRNPFKSEQDAFRVLVIILIAAASVIAAAVLISSTSGAILAVILIAAGLWKTVGWLRVAISDPDEAATGSDDAPS